MGFRTVVMLNNDYSHEWSKDPMLGQHIYAAMNNVGCDRFGARSPTVECYGEVVECVHADTETLAVLGLYTRFNPISYDGWRSGEAEEDRAFKLLKSAADKLGYKLVKKPVKD